MIDNTVAGFPWWIVCVILGGLLIAVLALWVMRPDLIRRALSCFRKPRGRAS